ncbi:uncharacterized protein LOC111642715 [Centruroides sculpturatus]|uniref:uncharacterized protein LOC111642715 n=1 Tax=Centruroides sculpturatus TaxID=218467 RepID=UPI000C6E53F0|nr:uncharacterized protein LOC111642715 [Centruroides sculpturatus]
MVLCDYFTNRSTSITYGADTIQKPVTVDCPQGSCSGPLLWSILLDDLRCQGFLKDIHTTAYADDVLIIISADSRAKLEKEVNRTLQKIYNWGQSNRLDFNPNKTNAIVITKHNVAKRHPKFHLNGAQINITLSFVYLGVTIDDNLSWLPHLVNLVEKTSNLFAWFTKVARRDWGLSGPALKTIYQGAIVPMVTYGASAWGEKSTHTHIKRKVHTIQRKILLRVTRAYRTISNDALHVLAGVLPLDQEVNLNMDLHLLRTENKIPAYLAMGNAVLEPKVAAAHCLTNRDIPTINERIYSTNKSSHIDICTDSRSAIEAIKDVNNKSPLVQAIWNTLLNNSKNNRYSFCWVKAHAGHPSNKTADKIAKEASGQATTNSYNLIARNSLKQRCKAYHRAVWQRAWETSVKGRGLFAFLPDVNQQMRCTHLLLDQRTSTFLSQHGNFNGYLHKYGHAASPNCDVLEDPMHLLYNCIRLENIRHELRQECCHEGLTWPTPPNKIINERLYNIMQRIVNMYYNLKLVSLSQCESTDTTFGSVGQRFFKKTKFENLRSSDRFSGGTGSDKPEGKTTQDKLSYSEYNCQISA